VKELGAAAKTTPPGTEALDRVFKAAGKPVLLLFDEVLNYLNRHRKMADQFHAFIQNLTVATTGTTYGAAIISLPRSQVDNRRADPHCAGLGLSSGGDPVRGPGAHQAQTRREESSRRRGPDTRNPSCQEF
jgi:hypothetical protein